MVKLSTLVNNDTKKELKVYLTNSIDMTGVSFTPIGISAKVITNSYLETKLFQGTFDGRGYVIDGLENPSYENASKGTAYTSLFGMIGEKAIIRNLVIGEHCSFVSSSEIADACAASLASRVVEGATIQNVLNLAPVGGAEYSGGLIARVDSYKDDSKNLTATLSGCTNLGSVFGKTSAGGLIGSLQGNLTVEDCRNLGSIAGNGAVGGLFGLADHGLSYNTHPITVQINRCIQNGSVTGSNDNTTGGFFGTVNLTDSAVAVNDMSGAFCYGSVSSGKSFCGSEYEPLPSGAPNAILPDSDVELTEARVQGVQMKQSGEKASLRFIGSIDDPERYSEVGFLFDITYNGKNYNDRRYACQTVFQSLLASKEGSRISYTAEQLRGSEGALFAVTVNQIPIMGDGEITFRVRSYTKDAEGTEIVSAESYTIRLTYSDGKAVLSV